MVDGVIVLVDAAEGPDAADQVRGRQGAEARPAPDRRHQQDRQARRRPTKWSTRCSTCSPPWTPMRSSSTSRSSTVRAKQGWMAAELEGPEERILEPLFDLVLEHVPRRKPWPNGPFRMLATTLEADPFLGRILTGRIESGRSSRTSRQGAGSRRQAGREGPRLQDARLPRPGAPAGRGSRGRRHRRHRRPDEGTSPTRSAIRRYRAAARPADRPADHDHDLPVNDSPLAGTEGDKVTSRVIRDRLLQGSRRQRRAEVEERRQGRFEVSGRGELQLAVLIETMRREGFELDRLAPARRVAEGRERQSLEPIEEVIIDVDEEHSGVVVQKLSGAQGRDDRDAPVRRRQDASAGLPCPDPRPDRLPGEFLTDTRGTAVMNRLFHDYAALQGPIGGRPTASCCPTSPARPWPMRCSTSKTAAR
jgi:GTP-binding protein